MSMFAVVLPSNAVFAVVQADNAVDVEPMFPANFRLVPCADASVVGKLYKPQDGSFTDKHFFDHVASEAPVA